MKNAYRQSRLSVASRREADDKSGSPLRRRGIAPQDPIKASKRSRHHLEKPGANTTTWAHLVSCETRNALQIVISAGEILLDGDMGGLNSAQQEFLVKILANARHISHLIATLTRPPDLVVEDREINVYELGLAAESKA